jgi:2-polyprenyl-6-methoxyphenol hydroxylase-like FAD-dependent oxidoreductase
VRIIDDAPIRHQTARASAIHARTLELLAPLGVADRIVAYAQPIRAVRFFDDSGHELQRRTPQPIDSPYPALQNLQQWHVEWILAEQLLARGIPVEADTRFERLTQDATSVTATVQTARGEQIIRARHLIGADGARSAVRHAVGLQLVGHDYPERWIAGELEIDDTHVQTESRILFGADRVALCFPLDAGFLFFATLTEDEFPDARPGPMPADNVLQIFQASFGRHPALSARVTGIPWTGLFRMHSCVVPDYQVGRVLLAGDAAHLSSAAGGFGMNAGIHDAINLAWRLAAHLRLGAPAGMLHGYSVDRREMFNAVNAASDAAHRVLVGRDPRALAGTRVPLPGPAMAAADRETGEVAFAYQHDTLWFDAGAPGALRAGMRVPLTADLSSGDGAARPWSTVYDGVHWTLLLAVPDRRAVRTRYLRQLDMVALAWLNARTRLVVAVGDAYRWNAPRPTLYVVRPDGYVAFRSDAETGSLPDIRRLADWFAQHFGADLVSADA